MAERAERLEDSAVDGSPRSPHFADRYGSEPGDFEQAKAVFLQGCGLPEVWAGQPQWCVLETGFGLGLNFLVTWAAWKADPQRPRLLHFVSTEAAPASAIDVLRSARAHLELLPFAEQLQRQFWGLLPGFHRLAFENGQVLLTLCIGDAKAMLREHNFEADSVYLDGFNPLLKPDIGHVHTIKAVARCCRRGTRIATRTVAGSVRDALAQCGFAIDKVSGIAPRRDFLQGQYQPAWALKKSRSSPARRKPSDCIVIGAGLAGAAVAASLARRGWQVTVLDAAITPATGASGLPAGVLAAHVSPDDSVLSRLTRSGIRVTLQQADSLLQTGTDWRPTGVLERCIEHARKRPAAWQDGQALADAAHDWATLATAERLEHCGLPPETPALWHVRAGWIKPARLVHAWLATPGVSWRGQSDACQLVRHAGQWQVLDTAGKLLAQAELVVLAAGHGSGALAQSTGLAFPLALQPIRGQASWGVHAPDTTHAMPAFPVNGHGSLVPNVPLAQGMGWVIGSTFERDACSRDIRSEDAQHNFSKLQTLLPLAAQAMKNQFDGLQVQGWAGIRCATPNRLPSLGPLENVPDVWVSSGMGSRGLSFAALCAELLAARLHGEPLPLEQRLADALLPQYVKRHANALKT